jgi:hypothetical protein
MRYSSYSFTTSALDGQRHAPPRFILGKGPPGTHWTGGWQGPRAGLDTEVRGENPLSLGSPVRCQTLYSLSYTGS